ncbi:MAG: homoserine kinase, partial [Bradymonadia bacterium]
QSQWAAQGFGDALASVFVGGRWTLTCDTRPHAHIGLGGACPSAAAGALAANSILTRLGRAPSLDGLCGVVAEVERRAHGLARPGAARAALVGGMGATTRLHPPRAVSLRPPRFWMVCVAPEVDVTQLDHKSVSMGQIHVMKHVRQSARSQGLLLALQASDAHGARDCFEDALIEPTLGKLIPGVYPALHAAREAGAIGAWVSGGGPVTCALASEEEAATEIRDAIVHAYLAHRIESNATIARLAPTRHTLHGWPHG